jgi:DNA polymerase
MSHSRSEFEDIVASARLILAELLEEGVDHFARPEPSPAGDPPAPPPARGAEKPAPSRPTTVAATAPARPAADEAGPTKAPPEWGPAISLESVRAELGDCRRCDLCEGRTNIVFGSGNPNADLLFVGEGPGRREDEQGLPFVGNAGELLTRMIEKGLEIPRQDVYICNIVKCRPPKNRDPLPPEVMACQPFLDGQISAVKPKVIVSLGKPAASLLLGRNVAITRERGTWQSYRGIPLMPTLHPAYLLRQYTPQNRKAVWEDLKAAHKRALEMNPS